MLDLSPTKLIIIFVVAIVLLGPKRLPQVARQLGAAWAKARTYTQRIDAELRQTMPDLPSSRDIVRYARSPITLLNELADGPPGPATALVEDPAAPDPQSPVPQSPRSASSDDRWPEDPAGAPRADNGATRPAPTARVGELADPRAGVSPGDLALLAVDDPTLN